MIIIPGDLEKGLTISQWLYDQGLRLDQDYTWYRKSRDDTCKYDRLVFYFADPKWRSLIIMKFS
jgi:hypothetical protein